MKIKNIFTILNGIVIVVMLGLAIMLLIIISEFNNTIKWVNHTYDAMNHADRLVSNMVDQETGMREQGLYAGSTDMYERTRAAGSTYRYERTRAVCRINRHV